MPINYQFSLSLVNKRYNNIEIIIIFMSYQIIKLNIKIENSFEIIKYYI